MLNMQLALPNSQNRFADLTCLQYWHQPAAIYAHNAYIPILGPYSITKCALIYMHFLAVNSAALRDDIVPFVVLDNGRMSAIADESPSRRAGRSLAVADVGSHRDRDVQMLDAHLRINFANARTFRIASAPVRNPAPC